MGILKDFRDRLQQCMYEYGVFRNQSKDHTSTEDNNIGETAELVGPTSSIFHSVLASKLEIEGE